jgi:hypothetical protein
MDYKVKLAPASNTRKTGIVRCRVSSALFIARLGSV